MGERDSVEVILLPPPFIWNPSAQNREGCRNLIFSGKLSTRQRPRKPIYGTLILWEALTMYLYIYFIYTLFPKGIWSCLWENTEVKWGYYTIGNKDEARRRGYTESTSCGPLASSGLQTQFGNSYQPMGDHYPGSQCPKGKSKPTALKHIVIPGIETPGRYSPLPPNL